MSQSVIQNNAGGLNFDDELSLVNSGDYIDAKNVRSLSNEGRSSKAHEIILGNQLAYTKDSIVAQNKIYSVENISAGGNTLTFYYSNGMEIGTTASFTDSTTAATEIENVLTNTVYDITYTDVTSDSFVMEISLIDPDGGADYLGWEYSITSTGDDITLTILQESYDVNMVGEMATIGSFDINGDLFQLSTTNNGEMSDDWDAIEGITAAFPPVITLTGHRYTDRSYVTIKGYTQPDPANGVHIIRVIDTNSFSLLGVDRTGYPGGAIANVFVQESSIGVGEIGVAVKDENIPSWTYNWLLRSKELNFSTLKQAQVTGERDVYRTSLYWTDNYNQPKVFYYRGVYSDEGAMTFNNADNIYTYGNINADTNLQDNNPSITVSFLSQQQTGGQLLAGNYRYAARLISNTLTPTAWTSLTNEVLVARGDIFAEPSQILGGASTDNTGKINTLFITGNISNLYKFIEIAYIQYTESGFNGGIFIRQELTQGVQELTINHIGQESDEVALDIGTLNAVFSGYKTAKSIAILDNRLILSNLTLDNNYDFSEYCSLWTHSLFKHTIDGIIDPRAGGEYKYPENVYNYAGYMLKERYRFFARFKIKNTGTITQPFYIDDITIDCSTYARRDTTLTDYDLTNINCSEVYVPYVVITPYDLSFLINGIPARDIIDEIYIDRVELKASQRQVLASGVMVLSVSGTLQLAAAGTPYRYLKYSSTVTDLNPGAAYIGEYPLYFGDESLNFTANPPTSYLYPGTGAVSSFTALRNIQALHFQDYLLGHTSITDEANDKILNYGQPRPSSEVEYSGNSVYSCSTRIFASINGRDDGANAVQELDVTELVPISYTGVATVAANSFSKNLIISTGVSATGVFGLNSQSSLVAATSTNATKQTTFPDYGVYYCQYFREKTADVQYGNSSSNTTIWTGARLVVDGTTPTIGNNIDVFGGDVFTQMCNTRNKQQVETYIASEQGGGCGLLYYSQNLVNTQIRNRYLQTDGTYILPYPAVPAYSQTDDVDWLKRSAENIVYNEGYTINNLINSYKAYNSSEERSFNLPVTIAYSDIKAQGSVQDNYRVFLPLNRKDLDLTDGEIVDHESYNGELVTLQPKKFMRQFFNTSAILTTQDGAEVITGDGAVLSRRGQTISTYGCSNKWSVIKGKSAGGNDVLYWVDAINKVVMRYGYDGSIPISIRTNMDAFFTNNMTWVFGKDTPANDEGIHGVWNEMFKEVIWTFRGRRVIAEFDPLADYAIGEVIYFQPSVYSTFNETGEFYTCIEDTNPDESPESNPEKWEIISHSNNDYYNEYTIVWSEDKNKFICFLTPLPKIYLKWQDGFLSPKPVSPVNAVYEHNEGTYATWYGTLTENGYISSIININPDVIKTAEAIRIDSDITPFRVEFTTDTQTSYLDEAEFTLREGNYESPVKNTLDSLGSNSGDTSRLYGRYIIAKQYFEHGVYQKIRNIIMKVRSRTRLFNR